MGARLPYRTIVAAPAASSASMSGSVRSVASSPAPTAPPGHAGALQKAQGKAVPHAQPTHPGTARSRPGIETPQDRSQAPSRTSSLDSSGAASGVASGASHFRTRSRDSDFRESRFYSGQRSPSVESSASLQKVQTNLHQSRQHMQEVEQTMQAMRGALESSKELLTRSSLAHGDDVLTVSAANEKEPTSLEELARRLQSQQEALIAKLTQRWEQRFAALEQALSSGLEVATAATGSMNDRLTRFVSLAEVLEGAVERVIHSSKDIATLSRKVSQIEDDVACLAQELASDQKGRSEAVTLAEVDAACEELRRELGPSLAWENLQNTFAKARHLGGSPPELLGALEQLPLEASRGSFGSDGGLKQALGELARRLPRDAGEQVDVEVEKHEGVINEPRGICVAATPTAPCWEQAGKCALQGEVPWEPAWTLRLAAVLSQLGAQGANLRLASGLSNALLQAAGKCRCQGFANHYVFAVLVEELEEQCSAGAMPLSELVPLLQGLAMANGGGSAYQNHLGPGMLACLRTGLATSGVAALSTPQLLQLQSSVPCLVGRRRCGVLQCFALQVGKDGPLAELIADLPSRVQRMSLPELAAAAPVLSTENAAWARLEELTRVDLDSESFEIALAVACALKSPPLKEHCKILEQLESAAASASPSLQARLLLLALRGAGESKESNAQEEMDTKARSVVDRVLTDVGGRLAAADLAGIPWNHAAELLQALARSSAQAPPGLVGGLVEVIFAGDMFDRTLGELATVFFALAELGADLENLATRCDLAAKLASAGELEQEALIRLFWAMAIGKVQDPVAWQLCTQLCRAHLADGSSLPEPLAQLRSEAEEARRQQLLEEEMQPKAAKVTNCYRDMVFVDISAEQDGCFRSPKGQQFRVGETLRNLAIRAVDLEKAESKNSAKAFGGANMLKRFSSRAEPSRPKGKAPAGQSQSQADQQLQELCPVVSSLDSIVHQAHIRLATQRGPPVQDSQKCEKDGCFRTAGRRFQVGEVLQNLQIRAVDLDKGFVHISSPSCRRPVLSVEGEGSGSNGSSSLNSLSAALGEERSERLRLSAEQRRMAKQAEQLESRLQTAQEQLAQVARAQQEAGTSSPGAGTSRLALLAGRSRRVSGSGSRSLGSRLIGPIEEEEEDEDGNKAKAKGTATQLVQRRSLKGWEASEPPAAPESDGGIFSRILGR
ncbi:unnamed protein product [Symbiodinium microadriaticum]|nr:unnamed protein product [Symbiodinium microadriaticum]